MLKHTTVSRQPLISLVAYRLLKSANLPQPTKIKRRDVRNTTGAIGVAHVKERTRSGKLLVRYVASWPKRNSGRGKASFSVGFYGEKEAFKLATNPNPGDFESDGTWYSMIAVGGDLYAVEPNHGELDKITPGAEVSRVVDISASQGHIVPTAITFHNGNFYVGNLNTFPIVQGRPRCSRSHQPAR